MQKSKVLSPAQRSYKIKQMVILALITSMAYVVVALFRLPIIPSVPFLDLEFKSAVILIGAYIFGPFSGLVMSVVISVIEAFTFSTTGAIGCIMNILATVFFVCPAALVYKRKRTTAGAIIGIIAGTVIMTVAMVLWNFAITPLYMGIPREVIVTMLLPAFVPFNLLKGGLNGGVALFLFKFVYEALQRANLIPESKTEDKNKLASIIIAVVVALFVIAGCGLIILALNGAF